SAEQTTQTLYHSENSVMGSLSKIQKNIETLVALGANAGDALESANSAYYQAEEIYSQINSILKNINTDPQALDNTQIRLELIKKLKKKYGATIEEILNYKIFLETELKNLNDHDANTQALSEELSKLHAQMETICQKISKQRVAAALNLAKKVIIELADLEMPKAEFEIAFSKKEISPDGFDHIEFMFNANVGQKLSPLKNTASGGELSRVMLALLSALGKGEHHTIIFDEIDTGTGGKAGQKIGEKLYNLSKLRQTFAITHIPQVAAFADTHVKIYKDLAGGKTLTKTEVLSEAEHIKEIARMISGEHITDSALNHAKELIKNLKG
ncbi:MAG: DNA repair protein RecN, partial [Elusimicrobia bacterium]|nr:DNA repair protein RecN [Elusimicrobiota bacterium]